MDENNRAILRGTPLQPPVFSHECRDSRFYTFPLSVERSSGTEDIINVIAPEVLLQDSEIGSGDKLEISGELRSFNNKSGVGSRLVITMFAKELHSAFGEDSNSIHIRGTICKPPTHRKTPMGREICDLMIAVNRRYGRSDYLPCIAWGTKAREASLWEVGDVVVLTGRIQSRRYIKKLGDSAEEKTAFEVSVLEIEREAD